MIERSTKTTRGRWTGCRWLPAALALLLGGCDAGPLVVEVGTGDERFEPLLPGAEVPMVWGPQGGYHVWMAARAKNAGSTADLLLLLLWPDREEPECGQNRKGVDLTARDGWREHAGERCFIAVPSAVAGHRLTLSGRVTVGDGRSAEASVEVVPIQTPDGGVPR